MKRIDQGCNKKCFAAIVRVVGALTAIYMIYMIFIHRGNASRYIHTLSYTVLKKKLYASSREKHTPPKKKFLTCST